jgi:hypothetical protein
MKMKKPGEWYRLEEDKLKKEYYCIKCHHTIETREVDITKLDPYKEEKPREIRIYACSCGEIYAYTF